MASKPPLPVVIISDYTSTPAISLAYSTFSKSRQRKNNVIYFGPSYKHIKSLLVQPRCIHKHPNPFWPCDPCTSLFTRRFWNGAKLLLDYFADFFAKDSPVMHSVWFHLFDVWQESIQWLPLHTAQQHADEYGPFLYPQVNAWLRSASEKASSFEKSFQETLTLIEKVIWGGRAKDGVFSTQAPILHNPRGEAGTPMCTYETGPWISGIKPWAQFLSSGGPGVSPPIPLPPLETGTTKLPKDEVYITKRYIPHGALALLKTHVERARGLADKHYTTIDKDNRNEYLAVFDRYTPVFPTPDKHTSSFVSPLVTNSNTASPRNITYTLGNGAPPVQRPETGEYADPDLQCLVPDWNLIDEAVAMCKGWSAYVPAGEMHNEDEDDDGHLMDVGEETAVFDMWSVIETRGGDGDGGGKRGRKEGEVLVLGEMFENWCSIGECLI